MNEGMYIAFRTYLEEHSSLLKRLIAEQQKTNELLGALVEGIDSHVPALSIPSVAAQRAAAAVQTTVTKPAATKPVAKP